MFSSSGQDQAGAHWEGQQLANKLHSGALEESVGDLILLYKFYTYILFLLFYFSLLLQ